MIITIDGPAGAGKSTAARNLAARLGFDFLDTGAMYRAVAWAALERGIDLADESAVANVSRSVAITFERQQVFVDGVEVTEAIRSSEVTAASRPVAANTAVREILSELQRKLAVGRNVVTEGRDQGTAVFPDAEFKFFLTASQQARAERRQQDFAAHGQQLPLEQILKDQADRDHRDAARSVGPLKPADDAIHVDTSALDAEGVVDRLSQIVNSA